jgi:alpha-N-arabinofuranosidase
VAAISLNHFNERCRRIKMANIAQTVNVLQAMILTDEEKMILTPTYHVFEMYRVHHDATLLPLNIDSGLQYSYGDQSIPAVSVSASKDINGKVHVSLVNVHPQEATEISLELRGMDADKVTGRILTADALNAHNTFDQPDQVHPESMLGIKLNKEMVSFTLPAHSIVVLELQ